MKISTLGALSLLLSKHITPDNNNIRHCQSILKNYTGNDWHRFIYRDSVEGYHRCLLERNDLFSLYVLTWYPQSTTDIHGHSSKGCCFKVLEGGLLETRFPENRRSPVLKSILCAGDTGYIDNEIGKHQISHIDVNELSASLHLYSPGYPVIEKKNTYDLTSEFQKNKFTSHSSVNI